MRQESAQEKTMLLVDEAENKERRARSYYRRAAQLEREARENYKKAAYMAEVLANRAPEVAARSRGIFRVHAVSLFARGRMHKKARELAKRYLEEPLSPGFKKQLRNILEDVERKQ
jgi:hypothetical protein